MEFMEQGGIVMWVILAAAIASVVRAALKRERASEALRAGSTVVLALGVLGMAMGMKAVAAYFAAHPDAPASLSAVGMGELANNGLLGAGLFLALGLASVVAGRKS